MKQTNIKGVFRDKNQIFTENHKFCRGIKVYNEKLIKYKNQEYRSWNPYRSKLAAAILNGFFIDIKSNSNMLYLGAATGTTVSHISDIITDGVIYAVESSPIAMNKMIELSEKRQNIIPILADANHPDRYGHLISTVNLIYQDISQRNQAEIFITNIFSFLKKKGSGVLMVKARNIDVSLKPKNAYQLVCSKLEDSGIEILNTIDLSPYEKDHAAISVSV
jgi:fibrillarin-like pre-rRNA processing protein